MSAILPATMDREALAEWVHGVVRARVFPEWSPLRLLSGGRQEAWRMASDDVFALVEAKVREALWMCESLGVTETTIDAIVARVLGRAQ